MVLANQQAKTVAEARVAVMVAIISVRGSLGLTGRFGCLGSWGPAKFFDRTESDAVGFAKGAVDGASFGDTHLGAVDQGGHVGGVGVPVADEAARGGCVV